MNECNVVKDLMPLYADDLLSPDSQEFIEDHASRCPKCRRLWAHRDREFPDIQAKDPVSEKQIIKKSLRRDRIKTAAKTLITTLLLLAIPVCYILQTLYSYGFMYDIEASYPSPDGNCILELVDRDTRNTRSDGYLIRFKLDRGVSGVNRYWTGWDTIEPHWAPDSIHLLLMLTDAEGNPEIRVLDTVVQETQGGTWEIPGLSDNLIPMLKEMCGTTEEVTFTFNHWSEDSELLVFDYETESGQTGQITLPRPTEVLTDNP